MLMRSNGDAVLRPSWEAKLPQREWLIYHQVLSLLRAKGLDFAIGGGFAFSLYSERWRNTKDLDLYILEEDLPHFVATIHEAGMQDYFPRSWYDRKWIYRSERQGIVIDLIYGMANHRGNVDQTWLTRGPWFEVNGFKMRALPVEEFIWAKLYVFGRDRCDWPDLLNIISQQAQHIDWHHLVDIVGRDAGLLGGLLSVLRWLCPEPASHIPEDIWQRVGLSAMPPADIEPADRIRTKLLCVHDWFGPTNGEVALPRERTC